MQKSQLVTTTGPAQPEQGSMSKPQIQEIQAGKPTVNHVLTHDQVIRVLDTACHGAIEKLEQLMAVHDQVDIPAREEFKDGLYVRSITIPKGTLLTGRVYKHDYVDIMLAGNIAVATPNGVKYLSGPNVCDGKAGRKRAGYAFDDTYWVTVHRADKMEKDMRESLSFFSKHEYDVWIDRQDFILMLIETGYTPEQVRAQSENPNDQCLIDLTSCQLNLRNSDREGIGLFACCDFHAGDVLCVARDKQNRTQGGRYTNHSKNPNAIMRWQGENIDLVACCDIAMFDEVLVDYRQSISLKN